MEKSNFSEYLVLFKRSSTATKHGDVICIFISFHVQANRNVLGKCCTYMKQ